ncbi:MAG: SDR family oxidoreductase [Rhodospirillaceae bacterium]|nr:SDR family oxidoreductase [Rhodospirillaceae bacterium]
MCRFLDGKAALVTGAASGIGRAIAEAFASQGAIVTVADRGDCSEAVAAIEAAGGQAMALAMDVTDEASVVDGFTSVSAQMGRLDLSVASAGISLEGPLLETSLADWNRVIGVNLTGVFLTGREAIRAMVAHGNGGRVISIASDHAYFGWEGRSAYNASKAGVLGLTRVWAREFGPDILVNAICPGPVATPLLLDGIMPEDMARETDIPLGRVGQPDEIAAVALALAGKAGSYTTGQAWGANGGSAMP